MKILITGGAGFIGSHLADRLLENGDDEVFIVDDLSTGRLANVEQNQDNERFHLVVDTILNEAVMNELVFKCDQIYHMAAAVGVKLIMNRPVETLETNVKGTEMILMLANRYKKRVLIASSSEVYGKIMDGENTSLLVEDTDRLMGSTTKRRWAYACSKALDEFLALAYFEEKKLPVIITRLFNTVGPRQTGQYGMVIPNFVQKALINKPITVYGDGNQSRSFTYIADVIDVLIKLMAEPEAVGKIFNVGNEEEVTIKDLALMVKEMTGSSSEIEYIPYEKAYGPGYEDMQRRCPDITRLKDFMHFKPKTDLKGTIQSVIDYYKK
ncbi:MAG: nucleoside-diphosphate sugar epimerase [Deltaproteobacteria bacterium]|nr:MAG: nucleoside-diphosphate sugar epimerase [Deltaproteobacteria bacterium]